MLKWSGTFNNDKAQLNQLCNDMERIVNGICQKFDEAKSYWIDDNDAKGKLFKEESEKMLASIKKCITDSGIKKNELFEYLDKSLKDINETTY